ncbi:uncharacterized protein [Temnothorax nylanderi]|uniref:uncharacterized protein n=1 Tax=Temnothorax nylanderi TaxID=102681 RepID=UPI003A8A8CC7
MSYAEHGPRIFLTGRPSSGVPLTYGDYILPQKRSEGRLKLYNSCTDIRAWSPNVLESTRYFRELNEHDRPTPGKLIPFNVVMENMIALTAQAQRELHVVRRELRGYRSLNLIPEQRAHLEKDFKSKGARFCLSKEFSLSNLKSTLKQSVASRAINFAERSEQASVCIEYVDASSQAVQDVCEIGVQTEECKDDDAYDRQSNVDSPSSQYYETTESVSTSESELGINSDPEVCERSHKGVIIQKDSEIIVLKNELGMKEDELEELRELNRHLKTLLKQKDEDSNILRRNVNVKIGTYSRLLQLKICLKIVSVRRDCETVDLSAKVTVSKDFIRIAYLFLNWGLYPSLLSLPQVSSFECLVDQLKAELARKCQVCYFQSQEIQKLRTEAKEAELLSVENESLTVRMREIRKVREMEHLSREAESCGIALEQMKNVWRERDTLQKQYHEQSCTLADREDEIKRLLTLIKQMSVTSDTHLPIIAKICRHRELQL